MSNRLKAEQFKQPMPLEDIMNKDLAEYCKELMRETGCDVKHAAQWCADRFDKKGKFNVSSHETGLLYVDKNAPWEKPKAFSIADGMIFKFDVDAAIEYLEALNDEARDLIETGQALAVGLYLNALAKFLEHMENREAYMIWRICYMQDADGPVCIHGMVLSTESGLDEGPQYAAGRPIPVSSLVFNELLMSGVFTYFGDAVVR